jgi:malate dehydrogenase (oxaloacetate-decarboxylating)
VPFQGTAFTSEERDIFALRARLPYQVDPLELQLERAYDQYLDHETPIRRNAFLQSLKAQNWVLYFALLQGHLKEMMPVVYTPTEVR